MSIGIDPGDPRGWGISVSFVDDEGQVVPPPAHLSFDDVVDMVTRSRRRGPIMAEMDRVISRYSDDPEAAQRLYEQGCMPPEDVRVFLAFEAEAERLNRLPRPSRAEAQRLIAGAYDLPEELIAPRPEYDELIEQTRSEFPRDPYDYGRRCPAGPMHWTPPPEGGEVPPCPV